MGAVLQVLSGKSKKTKVKKKTKKKEEKKKKKKTKTNNTIGGIADKIRDRHKIFRETK